MEGFENPFDGLGSTGPSVEPQPAGPPPIIPTIENILAALTLSQERQNSALAQSQQRQNEILAMLAQATAQGATSTATSAQPNHEPKANKPFVFKGDRTECSNFIARVQEYMSLTRTRYNNPCEQIIFIATYLEGDAQNWWRGLLRENYYRARAEEIKKPTADESKLPANPDDAGIFLLVDETPFVLDCLQTLTNFYDALHRAFGDRDAVETAKVTLKKLVQTTSVSAYAAKFRMYCYLVNDTDE